MIRKLIDILSPIDQAPVRFKIRQAMPWSINRYEADILLI
jgi:hypothetical protein